MGKADDPQIQRVHRENAERTLLASFVSGLTEVSGTHVRFANPLYKKKRNRTGLTKVFNQI